MEGVPVPKDFTSLVLVAGMLLFMFLREYGQSRLKQKEAESKAQLEGDKEDRAAKIGEDQAKREWHTEQAEKDRAIAQALTDKVIDDLKAEKSALAAKVEELELERDTLKASLTETQLDLGRARLDIERIEIDFSKEIDVWARAFFLVEQHPHRLQEIADRMLRLGDKKTIELPMPDGYEDVETLEEISAERRKETS